MNVQYEIEIKPEPLSENEDNEAETRPDDSAAGFDREHNTPPFCGSEPARLYVKPEVKDEVVLGPMPSQNSSAHDAARAPVSEYSCDICNKAFKQRSSLQRHNLTHSPEKPFSCTMCSKRFRFKKSLTVHMFTHGTRKKYKCDICHRSFSWKPYFVIHKLLHTRGQQPQQCSECSEWFKTKSSLQYHMFSHEKEEDGIKHICNICNKQFKRKCNLERHAMVHTGEKLYSCDRCGTSFQQKSSLRKHINNFLTHTPKVYSCDRCNQKFCTNIILRSHSTTNCQEAVLRK